MRDAGRTELQRQERLKPLRINELEAMGLPSKGEHRLFQSP